MKTKQQIQAEIEKINRIVQKPTKGSEYARLIEARIVLEWVLGEQSMTPTTLMKNLGMAEEEGRKASKQWGKP